MNNLCCILEDYKVAKTELKVIINGKSHILSDLACETCPTCGEITFTHEQYMEIYKKRIALEFGLKPLLTPNQLLKLRHIMDMKLEEICELLHIDSNTYGSWERGELEITPSMNLLVHSLMEKLPGVREKVLENSQD